MSALLRASGLPRHALRLRDTDEALRESVIEILRPALAPARLELEAHALIAAAGAVKNPAPAHRALPDANGEYEIWFGVRRAAREVAATHGAARRAANEAVVLPPWMPVQRRTARSLCAATRDARGAGYSVHVVLLHDCGFPERWGLYVGQTSRDPDWRFDQHKSGYEASGAVRRFGVQLLPELFDRLNPLQRLESLEIEARLAVAFQAARVAWIEGGH